MPHLNELHDKYKDQGLVILAIHSQNGREKCAAYVKDKNIRYVVCEDDRKIMQNAFGVDGFPDYQVVGRDGKVKVADLANGEIDRAIETFLAEPAPKETAPEKDTSPEKAAPEKIGAAR